MIIYVGHAAQVSVGSRDRSFWNWTPLQRKQDVQWRQFIQKRQPKLHDVHGT